LDNCTGVVYLACGHMYCLASNLLALDIGADSNIGRVGPSHGGGSNSVGTVASKRGSNMGVGKRRGNNVVVCGQGCGNMVVGGGHRGSNSSDGRGSKISGQRGSKLAVGSSQRGSTIEEGGVSLSLSLTLANVMSVVEPIVFVRVDKRGCSIGCSICGQRGSNSSDSRGSNIWR